jgi:hypothetical protein
LVISFWHLFAKPVDAGSLYPVAATIASDAEGISVNGVPVSVIRETYTGREADRAKFLKWYRTVHLKNVGAIEKNSAVLRVEVGEVKLPGTFVEVRIYVVRGRESEVANDPGIKVILDRAKKHGARVFPYKPMLVVQK